MADMDHELAIAQINALIKVPGALKIITAEHACGIPAVVGEAFPTDPAHQKACEAFAAKEADAQGRPLDLQHPKHFVLHDVVAIEELAGGIVRASTKEGDWTEGKAMAVLNRLQQWRA